MKHPPDGAERRRQARREHEKRARLLRIKQIHRERLSQLEKLRRLQNRAATPAVEG